MSDQYSELVEISKLNGDFKRNYGRLIGAYLYLRSVGAARSRSWYWAGLLSVVCRLFGLARLAVEAWTDLVPVLGSPQRVSDRSNSFQPPSCENPARHSHFLTRVRMISDVGRK
jgi:hypothetical protein